MSLPTLIPSTLPSSFACLKLTLHSRALLAELNSDSKHAFGTAYWYMASECEAAVLPALDKGDAASLQLFADCTGTGPEVVSSMRTLYAEVSDLVLEQGKS